MAGLCEVYVSAMVGHCPEPGAFVRVIKDEPNSGIILCEAHGEALSITDTVLFTMNGYAERYGWNDRESPIIGGRISRP